MGIRSKFKGKNTKYCILKAVLKKNATVVVKVCPKTCFVFPQSFYPNFVIFLHRNICHICDILQLCRLVYWMIVCMINDYQK